MKYTLLLNLTGSVFNNMVKPKIKDKKTLKLVKVEYKNILKRAKDIGTNNLLIISYAMGAYFIALNRKTNFTSDELIKFYHDGIKNSRFTLLSLGKADAYLSEKKKAKRRIWAKETQKRKYENDWVVEIHEEDPNIYEIDYLECGICKLCRDEKCIELAKYLCSLDFLLADMMGLKLERTQTLAEGGTKCDFCYHRKN